jgi:hypothetical protein
MTLEDLRRKVSEWDLRNDTGVPIADSKYSYILAQLEHYAARDWRVYLPAEHPDFNNSYLDRLASWIGNLPSEDDQKLLLEYALCISFFSHEDFSALYRTALDREIMRWIAGQVGARLETGQASDFDEAIRRHIHQHTWFCPVTDSMDINEFYKVNHLKGVAHRPCFATLQKLAQNSGPINPTLAQNVIHYMQCPGNSVNSQPSLERLVLLEDIVGSGTQCLDAVRWAVENLDKPVLFVPLILCPNGVEALREEEQRSAGRLTVRPVVQLHRSDLLGPERQGHAGWQITPGMEELATRCSQGALTGLDAFGYKNTGCSLTTFSNTPDNTLPMVHHKTADGSWEPLFPRVFRE